MYGRKPTRGLQHEGQADSLGRTFVEQGNRLVPGKEVGEQLDMFQYG